MEVGFRAWLLRRDPDLLAVRRAGRVTVVACLGFYVCYYLVDRPVMATFALFAAVATGFLSQVPGPDAHRSVVLLRSLPLAVVLVTAGTLLAGDVWAATAGVLVVGFVIEGMAEHLAARAADEPEASAAALTIPDWSLGHHGRASREPAPVCGPWGGGLKLSVRALTSPPGGRIGAGTPAFVFPGFVRAEVGARRAAE